MGVVKPLTAAVSIGEVFVQVVHMKIGRCRSLLILFLILLFL
jgi:hypothetical protein